MSQTKAQLIDNLVQPITGALGSASAPTFSFTADPNTGVYSPGADQLALSTGGTGRLFVDANGNVAVGTSSIGGTFQVNKASATEVLFSQQSSSSYARLKITNDSTNTFELIQRGSAATGGLSLTAPGEILTRGATPLAIFTESSQPIAFGTNNTERMRLDSSGGFQFKGAGTAGVTQAVSFNGSAPVNSLVIDSSGRLGVGTSSPNVALDVNGAIGVRTNNYQFGRITTNNVSAIDGGLSFQYVTGGTFTTGITLDAAGRVGIGTTSPEDTLHVTGSIRTEGNIKVLNSGALNLGFNQGGGAFLRYNPNGNLDIAPRSGYSTVFLASDGGTERARIDSSGRLLVGASTEPTGSVTQYAKFFLAGNTGDATASSVLALGKGSAASNGDTLGQIYFTDSTNGQYAFIGAYADAATGSGDNPGRLVFSTTADGASSPTERTRINSAGAFKTSTNGAYISASDATNEIVQSNSFALGLSIYASSASYAATLLGISCNRNTANNTFSFIEASIFGVAYRFRVADSGNVTNANNSYGALSDRRLKENIVDAASQWNDVKALQVRKYNFKEETGQPTHAQIGLIAQEVELVSPGLVTESPDRDEDGTDLGTTTKSVNYSVLYMKAVKALQEAMDRIETLEAKVAALEGV
jgi:hypothetical protein